MSDNRKSGQVPGSRTPPPGKESQRPESHRDLRSQLDWNGSQDIHRRRKPEQQQMPPEEDQPQREGWFNKRSIIFLVLFFGLVTILASLSSFSIFDRPMLMVSILTGAVFGLVFARGITVNAGTFVRHLAIWGVLILAMTGLYYMTGQPETGRGRLLQPQPGQVMVTDQGELVVPRAADGHYWLNVSLNGQELIMMVDTGASDMVLARRDAEKVGIDTSQLVFSGISNTANGEANFGFVRLKTMDIGPIKARDVPVSVMEDPDGLITSLFGMAALEMFSSFEFRDGQLILRP